jgi:hypothetical protein
LIVGRARAVSDESEEVLEAEAVEESAAGGDAETDPTRRLPAPREEGELAAWRGEVRTAAIAAAGGVVAGVATVAAVNAVRSIGSARLRRQRRASKRERAVEVVASRSFLIDVHVLGR